MSTTHITFRGEEDVEIEYRDHGYEFDTGAHEIDWWFVGRQVEDMTPAEEELIYAHLYRVANEPRSDHGTDPLPPLPRDRPIGTPLSELSGWPGLPGYAEFKRIARSWGYD